MITLMFLIYISPLISALVMLIIPVISVYLLPEQTIQFLSIQQFSFLQGTLLIQNIHILLAVWSALIGIVAYTEIISWYLLVDEAPKPKKPDVPAAVIPIPSNAEASQKSVKSKVEDFLLNLGKMMSGKK
ncbi:MAG: hypothetical protein O8C66_13655 [Candidatus Methanoperedens sp.]|nr:hypothetical protein [Candidatus Methanoperedens sp.]MCZ7371544.1 hypothetical protein [Candidatus Methanoperedens sp.]